MTPENLRIVGCVLALLGALVIATLIAWSRRLSERSAMPGELRDSELWLAEKPLRCDGPEVTSARVDRAYRRADGCVVLLELKTRPRSVVHASDVIELSAQRLVVEQALGCEVASHGYVLVRSPAGRDLGYHRVRLWSRSAVVELAQRRLAVLAGRTSPQRNGAPHLCGSCVHRRECRATSCTTR